MDEALVEDPQHDVDHHDGEQQQEQQALLARLKCLRRTTEGGADGGRQGLRSRPLHLPHRVTEGDVGRQVERQCHGWQLAAVIDAERAHVRTGGRDRGERYQCPVLRTDVEEVERAGIPLVLRQQLEDHPILVVGRVDRRDLT